MTGSLQAPPFGQIRAAHSASLCRPPPALLETETFALKNTGGDTAQVRAQRGQLDAPPADLAWMAAAAGEAAAEQAERFMVQAGMTLRERSQLIRCKYEQRRFMAAADVAEAAEPGALRAAAAAADVSAVLRLLAAGARVDEVRRVPHGVSPTREPCPVSRS
jgi:hypothetical protein